ncbi:MAG: hypothetical protein WCQ57_00080 [Verrucomicrobiota bacterium]
MRFQILLTAFLFPLALLAELAPSAYEAMQAKATEYLRIEVLRVDVEPGEDSSQQKVHLVAMAMAVQRTATSLKPDEIINILYTITNRPAGWAGPGQIPLLAEKDQTVAYLTKTESGDFVPAAGRMSFSNF